jgi:peptidoglycan hydrolase FlgJ
MTTAAVNSPLLATGPASVVSAGVSDRDQLKAVAKQFEAVFLRQMMGAARKTNFEGENGLFGASQGMDTFKQMQDERFADIASETGAFGLAKMIEAHLARFLPTDTAAAATSTEAKTHVL